MTVLPDDPGLRWPALPPLDALGRDLATRRRTPRDRTARRLELQWLQLARFVADCERSAGALPWERLATALAATDDPSVPLEQAVAAHDADQAVRALSRLATAVEDEGGIHLAHSVLRLIERFFPGQPPLERGRLLIHRARLARQVGAMDDAAVLAGIVERMGLEHAEPELTARAWNARAVNAIVHGNIPEARRWFADAALVADDFGLDEVSSMSHQGLLAVQAKRGEFSDAIVHGWAAFRAARADARRQAATLVDLGQAMLDAGYPEPALRSFGAAVRRHPIPRFVLPALSGGAQAAAALGRPALYEKLAERLEAKLLPDALPYESADALVIFAEASSRLGRADAVELATRAARLAARHGFHEVAHRAQAVLDAPPAGGRAPALLEAAARKVVAGVEDLETADIFAITG